MRDDQRKRQVVAHFQHKPEPGVLLGTVRDLWLYGLSRGGLALEVPAY